MVFLNINNPWSHSGDIHENQLHTSLMSIPGDSKADGVGSAFRNGSVALRIKMLASRWLLATKKPLSESNEIDHLLNLMLYSKWKLQEQT